MSGRRATLGLVALLAAGCSDGPAGPRPRELETHWAIASIDGAVPPRGDIFGLPGTVVRGWVTFDSAGAFRLNVLYSDVGGTEPKHFLTHGGTYERSGDSLTFAGGYWTGAARMLDDSALVGDLENHTRFVLIQASDTVPPGTYRSLSCPCAKLVDIVERDVRDSMTVTVLGDGTARVSWWDSYSTRPFDASSLPPYALRTRTRAHAVGTWTATATRFTLRLTTVTDTTSHYENGAEVSSTASTRTLDERQVYQRVGPEVFSLYQPVVPRGLMLVRQR